MNMADLTFPFASFTRAEDAEKALEALLPKGEATPEDVERFIRHNHAEYFGLHGATLAARYIQPSSSMVHILWSLAFDFDLDGKLEGIVVKRGFSGP